jgi:hypothetical protein
MRLFTGLIIILFTLALCVLLSKKYTSFKSWIKTWLNRESFTLVKDLEDPVYLYNWIIDLCETNASPQLNYNAPYEYAIMDKNTRTDFVKMIQDKGIVFETPIDAILTSATLPPNDPSGLKTTGLTTIICSKDHNCISGSNVEISGINGLNGYYKNGVSLWNASNEKSQNKDRVDLEYNPNTGHSNGSAGIFLHSFHLIKESHQIPHQEEGIFKGYALDISPDARVRVTHRIYSSMPFNEWLSAVVASLNYLYGTSVHTHLYGYVTDVYGSVVSDWASLSSYVDEIGKIRMRNVYWMDPANLLISNEFRHLNIRPHVYKYFHLVRRGCINDPYSTVSIFDNAFKASISSYYNQTGIPDIYGPTTFSNIIPILNYCTPGSVKNVYWGLDGSGPKTREQQFICESLRLFNITNKSIDGGTTLVGKLFDFVNPYDKDKVKEHLSIPDPQTWVLMGATDTIDGRDRKNNYLRYFCGIIDPKYTKDKKIGYIYFSDFDYGLNSIAKECAYLFSPPPPKGFEDKFNIWFQAQYALMNVLNPIFEYLVTKEKCDSIIYDNRGNRGGLWSESLVSFFGGDRFNWGRYQIRIDSGYSPIWKDNSTQFDTCFDTIHSSLANTLGGNVFKGTESSPKKIVFLNNYSSFSEGEVCPTHFYGDNGDGYIGNHVYSHFIGSKSIGCINAGGKQFIYPSALSSRMKIKLPFSLESGLAGMSVALYTVPKGPLYRKSWFSEGFWNRMRESSIPIPDQLKGLAGGTSLRNDMSILYYALGLVNSPGDYFITYPEYQSPTPSDPLTWKDPWLEQAIRESCSTIIMQEDIHSYYPEFKLIHSIPSKMLSETSCVVESGEYVISSHAWNIREFNIQINARLSSGVLEFDPTTADDNRKQLVSDIGSDEFFFGFMKQDRTPLFGVLLAGRTYTLNNYGLAIIVPNKSPVYKSRASFPLAVSILVQSGKLVYYTINGYNFGQQIVQDNLEDHFYIGAIMTKNLQNKISRVLIEDIDFQ